MGEEIPTRSCKGPEQVPKRSQTGPEQVSNKSVHVWINFYGRGSAQQGLFRNYFCQKLFGRPVNGTSKLMASEIVGF